MSPELRVAIYWRALSVLESHWELIHLIASEFGHRLLALSSADSKPARIHENVFHIRVRPYIELHPACSILTGWPRETERFDPDAFLFLDEPYCFGTYQAARWAKSRGIPFIFLSCQNIDRSLPFPFSSFEKKVLQWSSAAWFLNEDAEARARNRGFSGSGRVIPLGVSPDLFPLISDSGGSSSLNRPRDARRPLTVGYVGRLVPEKGVTDLIQACAGTKARLLVVGEGPERTRLEAEAKKLGVQTEWLGRLEERQVYKAYLDMDIFVLPSRTTSRWKEQFGRVLVEAMASGVPVVGSDSGEIPRVVRETGWIYPEGNVPALRGALEKVFKGGDEVIEKVTRGLERVRNQFTWRRIAGLADALIRETLRAEKE